MEELINNKLKELQSNQKVTVTYFYQYQKTNQKMII